MKEDPPETKAELLLHLSNEVSRIAGSLAQLSIGAGTLPPRTSPFCNQNEFDVPPERVDWLIKARRGRADYLTRQLFSDPAWDILLELLRAEIAQERVSASKACIAASVPTSTGLRWLRALEHHGLVVRQGDLHDSRRTFAALSDEASLALRRYFLEVIGPAPSERW
jgi:DNA-binding MarR family transcriptional regulator